MTISVCMIVKNEESNLAECLACLKEIADEIIIVDTGSTDRTKKIAAEYTDQIFDFTWTNDFAAARNYAFSKATKDYIYSADADERLDAENRKRFLLLKEALLPEIEIVQMYYCNQLENNTIYSYDKEYRPKLYKRIRQFVWQERVHEAVALQPVVFDSDIEIIHKPSAGHAKRDLLVFGSMLQNGETLSRRLREIYAKELYIAGDAEDLHAAENFLIKWCEEAEDEDALKRACCILAKYYRIQKNDAAFMKYALKTVALNGCSEMCYEIGEYYFDQKDYPEAAMWYYNAINETEALLDLACKENYAKNRLQECGVGDLTESE